MDKQFTANDVRRLSNRIPRNNDEIADAQEALRAYADMLEADERAEAVYQVEGDEPDGWFDCQKCEFENTSPLFKKRILYTHPSPADAEKRETMTPRELAKRIERGEKWKLADEPTPCQSRDAERLAEAVRNGLIDALRHQRQIDEDGAEVGVSRQAVDEAAAILSALAAHSAQAQPANEVRHPSPEWFDERLHEELMPNKAQAQPPAASVPDASNYPPKMRYTTGQNDMTTDTSAEALDYWVTAATADACIDRAMAKESGR